MDGGEGLTQAVAEKLYADALAVLGLAGQAGRGEGALAGCLEGVPGADVVGAAAERVGPAGQAAKPVGDDGDACEGVAGLAPEVPVVGAVGANLSSRLLRR